MYFDKKHPYNYIFYAFTGAILFTLIYHVSILNKYKISAFVATIPILGLYGLFIITINNGDYIKYIKTHIKFILITSILYITTLFFVSYLKFNFYLSLLIGSLLWLIINFYNLS